MAKGPLYEARTSGKQDSRPGLTACLKALRRGDTLVIWKFTGSDVTCTTLSALCRT